MLSEYDEHDAESEGGGGSSGGGGGTEGEDRVVSSHRFAGCGARFALRQHSRKADALQEKRETGKRRELSRERSALSDSEIFFPHDVALKYSLCYDSLFFWRIETFRKERFSKYSLEYIETINFQEIAFRIKIIWLVTIANARAHFEIVMRDLKKGRVKKKNIIF